MLQISPFFFIGIWSFCLFYFLSWNVSKIHFCYWYSFHLILESTWIIKLPNIYFSHFGNWNSFSLSLNPKTSNHTNYCIYHWKRGNFWSFIKKLLEFYSFTMDKVSNLKFIFVGTHDYLELKSTYIGVFLVSFFKLDSDNFTPVMFRFSFVFMFEFALYSLPK